MNAISIMSVRFLLDYWSLTNQISDETARRSALCRIFYLNNFFSNNISDIIVIQAVLKPSRTNTNEIFSVLFDGTNVAKNIQTCVAAAAQAKSFWVSVYRTQSQLFYLNRLMYTIWDWFWLHLYTSSETVFFIFLSFRSSFFLFLLLPQHMKTALRRASFHSLIFIVMLFHYSSQIVWIFFILP